MPGRFSNDVPPLHFAERSAYHARNMGGLIGGSGESVLSPQLAASVRPNSGFNPLGHSPVVGRNSPSSLHQTFGR